MPPDHALNADSRSAMSSSLALSSATSSVANAVPLNTTSDVLPNVSDAVATNPTVPVPNATAPDVASATAASTKRKRYTDAAKEIAIYLGLHFGATPASRELGINRGLISKWKREFPASDQKQLVSIEGAEERELESLLLLKPSERSLVENCRVFQHEVSAPPPPKRQRSQLNAASSSAEGEGGQNVFAEFWEVDGVAERYLEELERIPESVLDETITLQLEKRVDPTLSAGARLLVEQSLDYAMRLRTQNKSDATNHAWQPRKRRFLMFWHRLQLLTKEIPSPVEEVQRDDEPSFDEEIDTSFDQQLAADEYDGPDDNVEDPEESPEPAQTPSVPESEGQEESPLRTVLATEDALLTWLRYDVLKSSPNLGYENIMQDIQAIADLFHDQQTAGLLPPTAKNPRSGQAVKAFLKRISRKRAKIEDQQ